MVICSTQRLPALEKLGKAFVFSSDVVPVSIEEIWEVLKDLDETSYVFKEASYEYIAECSGNY